jgi:hypothetical protein
MRSDEERALERTLEELAALGDKRCGSEAGARCGEYLARRFRAIGLAEVCFEEFRFPRHETRAASLAITLDGAPAAIGFDVLEGSGSGTVEGEIVWVGSATAAELDGRSLAGRIALVDRNPLFHRSAQTALVAEAGARALIYASTAPHNLRQVGSVRRAWEALAEIPCLTIGKLDAATLHHDAARAAAARAAISVDAIVTPSVGRNVVGRVPGEEPHQIVVGAHYDTWFAGSTDNGGGVAALLALATRRATRVRPRHTLVFVAWDGEELALYGGYHFLRRHLLDARAPILAVLDLETPSAHGAQLYGLAHSQHAPLGNAIQFSGTADLFGAILPMAMVPELMGGTIPTDVQGLYRGGAPSLATAVDSPFFHTVEDTPDKVDIKRLADTVESFDRMLDRLLAEPAARFSVRDPALWKVEIAGAPTDTGGRRFQLTITDGKGAPQPDAPVEATLLCDHFFETARREALTDEKGRATIDLALEELGPPPRFLHVTAGPRYPLVEGVFSV